MCDYVCVLVLMICGDFVADWLLPSYFSWNAIKIKKEKKLEQDQKKRKREKETQMHWIEMWREW